MGKCCTDKCKKESKSGRYCYAHAKLRWRDRNPEKYVYNNLKTNAKRRGKDFDISFEDFQRFCQESDYMVGKGRTKQSYHIDRIDESRGYTIDNIQILTNSDNVKKFLRWQWDGNKMLFSTFIQPEINTEGVPF